MHTLNSSVVLETKCLEVQNIPKIEEQNLDKPKMYNQKPAKTTYANMYFWKFSII
jgi:hypothetical protein